MNEICTLKMNTDTCRWGPGGAEQLCLLHGIMENSSFFTWYEMGAPRISLPNLRALSPASPGNSVNKFWHELFRETGGWSRKKSRTWNIGMSIPSNKNASKYYNE